MESTITGKGGLGLGLGEKVIRRGLKARLEAWRQDPAALLCLGLGLLLSLAGEREWGLAPFCGAGAAGSWMAGYAPWPALLGGMLGSLFTRRYAAAAICLVYGLLSLLWLIWRGSAQRPDKLLLLGAAHLILLPFFYFRSVDDCMLGLAQASLSLFSAPLIQKGIGALYAIYHKQTLTEESQWGLWALWAMVSMAAMSLRWQGVYLGCCLAAFGAFCAAAGAGILGVAGAALLGAGTMLGGASLAFGGSLTLCALCAAPFRRRPWIMAAMFLSAGALCALFVPDGGNMILYAALGSGAYLLLPGAFTRSLRRGLQPARQGAAGRQLARCRARLRDMSRVFSRLAAYLEQQAQSPADRFLSRQLGALSQALSGLLEGEGPAPRNFSLSLGTAACPKAGSPQSGDSMATLEAEGLSLLLLSDGMGSGAAAHRESTDAIALLGELLRIGMETGAALELVNRLLMAGKRGDMYATLDILLFDPASGGARFIKQGAPPSYILRRGRIYTIHAETLPLGILSEAAPAPVQEAALHKGDAVVLMTDGLFDALGQELLAAIIEEIGAANTAQDGAEALLRRGREKSGQDDMTVLVARVG